MRPSYANLSRPTHTDAAFVSLDATHFRSTHFEGSCGWTNRTNQFIASVAVNASATDGALCGRTINVTSLWNGESVLAQIVDGVLHLISFAFFSCKA